MPDPYCLVLCTCPEGETAAKLADQIVENRLGACVNIVSGITSVYAWKGYTETDRENLLLIKTRNDHYPQLESFIKDNHPNELPEIIAVPIKRGFSKYFNWIDECLGVLKK